MVKEYPTSVKDFRGLIEGDYYFVDKTMMIADICTAVDKTFLYTRPRRFGKSINLSMLDYYFNMKYKNDKDIFKGLKIDSCEKCTEYKNTFPVIRMNFGDLRSESVEKLWESIIFTIAEVMNSFDYLKDDDVLTENERTFLKKGSSSSLNSVETLNAINKLCKILFKKYGKRTIVLVDEYDKCIQKIHSEHHLTEIINVLGPFMEQSFKSNENIQFGVVTGIMPLAKTGMLSNFNNPIVCDILTKKGDEYFGFTESEVEDLLKEIGTYSSDIMENIREWYDGYRFGKADVFNPYSVISYLDQLNDGEDDPLMTYWDGTTGGGLSKELISQMDDVSLIVLRDMFWNNTTIESRICTKIVYSDLFSDSIDPSLIYSYLALAGYLRAERTGRKDPGTEEPICRIGMVNREIRRAFEVLVDRAKDAEKKYRSDSKSTSTPRMRNPPQRISRY